MFPPEDVDPKQVNIGEYDQRTAEGVAEGAAQIGRTREKMTERIRTYNGIVISILVPAPNEQGESTPEFLAFNSDPALPLEATQLGDLLIALGYSLNRSGRFG